MVASNPKGPAKTAWICAPPIHLFMGIRCSVWGVASWPLSADYRPVVGFAHPDFFPSFRFAPAATPMALRIQVSIWARSSTTSAGTS
jgi:hypothetical protein